MYKKVFSILLGFLVFGVLFAACLLIGVLYRECPAPIACSIFLTSVAVVYAIRSFNHWLTAMMATTGLAFYIASWTVLVAPNRLGLISCVAGIFLWYLGVLIPRLMNLGRASVYPRSPIRPRLPG